MFLTILFEHVENIAERAQGPLRAPKCAEFRPESGRRDENCWKLKLRAVFQEILPENLSNNRESRDISGIFQEYSGIISLRPGQNQA